MEVEQRERALFAVGALLLAAPTLLEDWALADAVQEMDLSRADRATLRQLAHNILSAVRP